MVCQPLLRKHHSAVFKTLVGDATKIWVFQIAGSLTMANGTAIILTQGALTSNVVWQVAGHKALTSKGILGVFETPPPQAQPFNKILSSHFRLFRNNLFFCSKPGRAKCGAHPHSSLLFDSSCWSGRPLPRSFFSLTASAGQWGFSPARHANSVSKRFLEHDEFTKGTPTTALEVCGIGKLPPPQHRAGHQFHCTAGHHFLSSIHLIAFLPFPNGHCHKRFPSALCQRQPQSDPMPISKAPSSAHQQCRCRHRRPSMGGS